MRASRKAVLGLVIALLVVAAGVGGWLLRGSDGGDTASRTASDAMKVGVPTIVSSSELNTFAGAHDPLYWAGKRSGTKLELTLTSKGAIFVRYLPKDADAGDKGKFLTVATYEAIDGYDALTAAKKNVADVAQGQQGAVIAVFKRQPLSTYFSFKDAGFQVEVFSPEKGESKKLTDDGSITLVGSKQ